MAPALLAPSIPIAKVANRMPVPERIRDLSDTMTAWRHDLHAHPELLYDVERTAGFVADRLRDFGCDEVVTGIGTSLEDVRREVSAHRALASAAAVSASLRIASCGLAPLADWRTNRPRTTPPYDEMAGRTGHLVREQLIAGLHVHVGIEDPDRAVGVLDRLRADLPVLLALSASSPYWSGADSGFASFRTVHW